MVVWDVPNRQLRISRRNFYEWLAYKEYPNTPVMRGLVSHFNMEVEKLVLAAGTPFKAMQEWILLINVPENSDMEDIMLQYKNLDSSAVVEVA